MTSAQFTAFLKKKPITTISVAVVLIFGGLIYYRHASVKTSQAELEQRTIEGTRIFANVKNSANLKEHFDALSASNKEVENRLMQNGELGLNLQYFYRLEAETGVHLAGIRPLPSNPQNKNAPKTNYIPIPFSVSVQGSFRQVFDFLGRIETGPHFVKFESAVFGKSGAAPDSPETAVVTLTLQIQVLGRL